MKNKKIKKTAPVVETINPNEPASGTIGELMEILKQFPQDAKYDLDGSITIDDYNMGDDCVCNAKINPLASEPDDLQYLEEYTPSIKPLPPQSDEADSLLNPVQKLHCYGLSYDDYEFGNKVRRASGNELFDSNISYPNSSELNFEGDELAYPQLVQINEIRQHNAYVAELMAEIHRREIAALLEYNTQCLAHLTTVSNKCMCEIVNKDNNYDIF